MIVTGAFLAEAAATVDNKLNVSGGVLARYGVGPDRRVGVALVVLIRAEPDADGDGDGEADASDRWVDVEIKPPTQGDPLRTRFEVPQASIGAFPGYAFFDIQAMLPDDGRWAIEVTGGGETISLPLVVTSVPPRASLGL
ncbi:MAG: hypothetical protein WCI78_05050 [Mycobacterium sp.]